VLSFFTHSIYANSCAVEQFHETVKVAQVYDGDTLKLTDGRKLRLIGINTPERGQDGEQDEPYYLIAKNKLKKIIHQNHNQIKVVFGIDKHDHYKRVLAHIFTMNNENITAKLIKKGMGFAIAISPNVQLLDCYQQAEQEAQKSKRGIWGHKYSQVINIASLKKSTRGFHLVKGKVDRIGESRSSFWLNLNSKDGVKFALRIMKKNIGYFKQTHPKNLIDHTITARGWIYQTKGEQRMKIYHPASLQVQNAD
jgi:endonuclease YncB( thermonuclease family)